MNKNTIIDYTAAVRAKYEVEKVGEFHSFLENLSPAQIRELCLLKFDDGLNKVDETIFRIYFKATETENLRNKIYNYETSKLKSIGSFISKINKTTSIQNLNLIAVLSDYNPRPFNKFSKSDFSENHHEAHSMVTPKKNTEIKKTANTAISVESQKDISLLVNPFYFSKKRILIGIGILLFFIGFGYNSKVIFLPKKECMQWQKDHYEKVSCKNENISFANLDRIKPINEFEFPLQKIVPTANTIYFKNGKPMVWYYKKGVFIELYNMPGRHPENGKTLKEITPYIIDKYLKK